MSDILDDILQRAVNRAYEVMDSKSFADPFVEATKAIESLMLEARIEEVENYPSPHGDPDKVEIAIYDRLRQLKDKRGS